MLNVLSYSVKIWTDLSSVLSQFTRLTDRQTDRRTDGQLSHRYTASALHAAR